MGFLLFLLVNGALFLRPAEILENLRGLSLYNYLILACLAVASITILAQFADRKLWQQPLTLLVFGLLGVVAVSLVGLGDLEKALENGFEFFKVVVYYVLLVTLVNTPRRLRTFLFWLTLFAAVLTLVSVLQFFQVIQLVKPDYVPRADGRRAEPVRVEDGGFRIVDRRGEGTVNEEVVVRLAGTGIFNDPNDLCLLFVLAIPLCLYWLLEGGHGILRLLWLGPLALFLVALYLTHSRGGFAAVVLAVIVLLWARFGPRIALVLSAVLLPVLLLVFAGRQTEITVGDTAQERFRLWNESFSYLKESPLFGIGMGQYEARAEFVAHNSFIQCYGELGLVGGTLFFGAFALALASLCRLNARDRVIIDPFLRRWNPYLLAIVAGYIGLMMSLSRSYIVPTYMVLGLVTVQLQLAVTYPDALPFRLEGRTVQRLCLASAGFLAVMYVALRLLVHYT